MSGTGMTKGFFASQDRREFGRRATSINAWIRVAGRPPVSCRVKNISEGGARIELPQDSVVPRRFFPRLDGGRMEMLCEVRHRRPLSVGVEFVVAEEKHVPAVDPAVLQDLAAYARAVHGIGEQV
jgi:methyl-accepting chemotaxis protein